MQCAFLGQTAKSRLLLSVSALALGLVLAPDISLAQSTICYNVVTGTGSGSVGGSSTSTVCGTAAFAQGNYSTATGYSSYAGYAPSGYDYATANGAFAQAPYYGSSAYGANSYAGDHYGTALG